MRRGHAAHEPSPQAQFHARTHLGDKALQHRDAGEQHLVPAQPADGVPEQGAGPIGARPAQRAQPAAKAEPDAPIGELPVTVAGANLARMPPPLIALAVGAHAGGISYTELGRQDLQDRVRHGRRVFQEGAEKADRRQLQRITQAMTVTPLGRDPFAILVVQVEITRQLVRREGVRIATVAFPLRGGQEADRHGVTTLRRRRPLG